MKLFAWRCWHTNLPRFQDAPLDHVQAQSSRCCFPRASLSFDQWHVTRSPPIRKRIWVGRYNKLIYSTAIPQQINGKPQQKRGNRGAPHTTVHQIWKKSSPYWINDVLGRTKLNDALGKQHLELWTCTWSGRASWNRGKFVCQQRQANNFNYKYGVFLILIDFSTKF